MQTPELVIVGHVTRDLIGHEERLGGPASFAALAAAAMGIETAVVTKAPVDLALLQPLLNSPRIQLENTGSETVTTFELDYSSEVRELYLRSRAVDILPSDLPKAFCGAPLAYLAPVIGEFDHALVRLLNAHYAVIGLQGWLRTTDANERIVPCVLEQARSLPRGIHAAVFSELDHPDAELIASRMAHQVSTVALTRGKNGVTLFLRDQTIDVAAESASEVDPTGAGDVFGIVFGLMQSRGESAHDAARWACKLAARVVEGPGLGTLPHAAAEFAAQGLLRPGHDQSLTLHTERSMHALRTAGTVSQT